MLTAVAYLRQSVARDRDDKDGGSVSTAYQLAAVERWCQQNGVTLLAWHQDVDESGASTTRKGLDAFLADVRRLQPAYAVFWDLKRLVRNLRLFLDVFDTLEDHRTQLVSCTEGTRHPAFVWKLLALMAEEERDRIAVNITHGKRESAKRGRHLGYAPLGYRLTDESELIVDEETAWIVRWMVDLAYRGHNPTAICRLANERGIPTPGVIRRRRDPDARVGATHWSRKTVTDLLRRPTYAGLVEAGAKSRSRYGRALGVVRAEASHPPLVDRAVWEAVQAALDRWGTGSARRGSWHWLAGRAFCAACGSRLYYVDAARKDAAYRDRYWRCRRSYASTFGREQERCPAPKARIPDRCLSPVVLGALKRALNDELDPEAIHAAIMAQHGARTRTAREEAERQLAELQAQRIAINDAIQMRVGALADLAVRDRALVQEIEALTAHLATLPEPVPLAVVRASVATARAAGDSLGTATPEQRAELATELGLRVEVDLASRCVRLGYRFPYSAVFGAE